MERAERLWPNGPQYWYDEQCFPPSTDSFLLGSFPALRRGERVCDLGAGAGLLGLLLLAREPSLQLTGIELDGHACHMMARNAAVNGFFYCIINFIVHIIHLPDTTVFLLSILYKQIYYYSQYYLLKSDNQLKNYIYLLN